MLNTVRRFGDRLLGRGDAAITVPVMDGALKPNRVLDNAEVVATLPDIDDLATDGQTLYASAGKLLYRLDAARLVEVHRFDADITALAVRSEKRLAVALSGRHSSCCRRARTDALARRLDWIAWAVLPCTA